MNGVYDFFDIDNYKKSDRTFGKIVESIENQDKAELKSLFSKNAIKEAKTLDKDIEDLFDFVKGNVVSFSSSKDIGRASSSNYDYGKEQTIIFPCFTLETDEEKYYLGIEQCVRDEFDRDNEGITYFCIINAEDWKDEHYCQE